MSCNDSERGLWKDNSNTCIIILFSLISHWFAHRHLTYCGPSAEEKKGLSRGWSRYLFHLFQKLRVMWSISRKLPWRHSLYFFIGIFTASVVLLQWKAQTKRSLPHVLLDWDLCATLARSPCFCKPCRSLALEGRGAAGGCYPLRGSLRVKRGALSSCLS